MSLRPQLCVVMIARDEAACIGECLSSAARCADRIVVGDTGSSDDTVAIAQGFGAQVISVPWSNDFAAARNAVLAQASGDWLLHLDADEFLDPAGAQALRALVDADGAGCDAIELTLANYCDDPRAFRWVAAPGSPYARGRAGYLAVPLLRLFRNGRGYAYREPVHENITASVIERGGRIGRAEVIVHHHGYDPDPATRAKKAARYLPIVERKAADQPRDAKAQHDYAEQLLALDRPQEAEAACHAALGADANYLPAVMTLANLLLNRGALGEARALLARLEETDLLPAHGRVALAAIDLRQGRIAEAMSRLNTVIAQDESHVLARLYRARAHDLRGEFDIARDDLLHATALASIPECEARLAAHKRRYAGYAVLKEGRAEEALSLLVQALAIDNEDPVTHHLIGDTLSLLGLSDKAAESYGRAAKLASADRFPA